MRIYEIILLLAWTPLLVAALLVPEPGANSGVTRRRNDADIKVLAHPIEKRFDGSISVRSTGLEKRRGGGGGAKAGGGGSSSGGAKSGGSSSGGSSSSSSSSGGGSSAGARGSSSSNAGGRTTTGSGLKPSYGGGYYGGGSSVPYTAGTRSPRGIVPFLLPLAVLSIFSGLWLYSVYAYPFHTPYNFTNHTLTNATFPNGVPVTLPALCLCQQYSVCGCDENTNSTYIDSIIGNGSWAAIDKTLAQVSNVNGTTTLVLNGTLPNGTTAAGGTEDPNSSSSSSSAAAAAEVEIRSDTLLLRWDWNVLYSVVWNLGERRHRL